MMTFPNKAAMAGVLRACRIVLPVLLLWLALFSSVHADIRNDTPIFTGPGAAIAYGAMLSDLARADVVFFGELHGNALSHEMERTLLRDLCERLPGAIAVGMEMFDSDVQLVMDEYLAGLIPKHRFIHESRAWPGYARDYEPIVELCRIRNIQLIATNAPHRYASAVFLGGLDALHLFPLETRRYFAPLPILYDPSLKTYREISAGMSPKTGSMHRSGKLVDAQVLRDATMAHFILKHAERGKLVLHFNGAYHSAYREGIVWFLLRERGDLRTRVITTVVQERTGSLDSHHFGKGDYLIVTPPGPSP